LLAFILENRRAVAIVKNKAHRDFIMKYLLDAVKTQGLAPDARPAKPEELTARETKRGIARPPAGPPPLAATQTAPSLLAPVGADATSPPPAAASMPSPPAAGCGPTLPGVPEPPAGGPMSLQPTTRGLAGFGAAVLL
jgi:hypothetical protein